MKKLISAMFFAVLAATAAMADALDTALFLMKSEMTIPGYAGSTTLANFPVLVRLAANSPIGFDYADCAADGSDLRFADADGNLIPHEIDTWKTSGESLVWVSVPSVSGTATAFTMYYGAANPSALPAVDPHDVWTVAGHRAVWHFAADETESAQGLTAKKTGTPSYANDGAVGKCWYSEGSAWLKYANDDSWSALGEGSTITISVWAKHEGNYGYNRILSTMSTWEKQAGYELTVQNNKNQITVGSSGKSQYQKVVSPGPMDERVYLTAVFNADRYADLYVNGVLQGRKQLNQVVQPTEAMTVACVGNGSNIWKGSLDELRLHAVAESADWIKACYDTMASENFVAMGDVLPVGGTIPLTVRLGGCTQTGTQAVIAGRLAQLGTGASSADVTLEWGTTDQLGSTVAVGTYTAAADLSATLTGLTPAATYYYAFKAVNNAETPETAWTATNSFVVEASTRFSDTLDIAVQNCEMAVTGTMTDWGVGTTVVELLVGTSADNLVVTQTVNLATEPQNMEVVFDPFTWNPGACYVAIRATTSYDNLEWVRTTETAMQTLADEATYTWKGGTGNWHDSTKWETSEAGAFGYPTESSTACFASGTTGVVSLAASTEVKRIDVSAADLSVKLILAQDTKLKATDSSDGSFRIGKNSTVVIDAQGGATAETGKTWFSAGASLCLLDGVKYKTSSTASKGDNASLKMTGRSCYDSGDHITFLNKNCTIELDDSNAFSWNTIQLGDGFHLIARGSHAQLSPRSGFSSKGTMTVDVELPETDYETQYNFLNSRKTGLGLIAYGMDAMKFPGGAEATINILKDSPGRKLKGTRLYTLVNCGNNVKLLDNSKVTVNGLKADIDSVIYTWADKADQETEQAQKMQVSITGGRAGTLIIIR